MEEESLMQEAIIAYDKKDFSKAKAIWETLSDANADAMVNLGTLHMKGTGTSKNISKAFSLFENAALLGHEQAAFYLGGMYENAIGVTADAPEAIRFYSMAAEAGMSTAQLKLAILLRNEDMPASMKWMIKAAHAGESQAQSLLTYVSNQNEAADINVTFRTTEPFCQEALVRSVIAEKLSPILASDGGGVELVNYVSGETPQIWLRYLGACSGCHLGPTSTAGMLLEEFEKLIDKNIVIYLW